MYDFQFIPEDGAREEIIRDISGMLGYVLPPEYQTRIMLMNDGDEQIICGYTVKCAAVIR